MVHGTVYAFFDWIGLIGSLISCEEAFGQEAALPGTHMQYIQHKHTNTHTVNQSVTCYLFSGQCLLSGSAVTEKLLPWPGLKLGTSHNHSMFNLVLQGVEANGWFTALCMHFLIGWV